MGHLEQLNIGFVAAEDRLLLRMRAAGAEGKAEYRLWLTRRFVKLLWVTLEQMLVRETARDVRLAPENREVARRFQEEAALQGTDFSTPFQSEPALLPWGEEPLLATKIQVGAGPDGQQILTINDAKNRGINITLDFPLLTSLRKLLADAVRLAAWDLILGETTEKVAAPAEKRSIN
jgi:hypothetical protein